MATDDRRPGFVFRWTRRLLILLAVVVLAAWVVSVSGLYFWFNVTPEDRVRVEYGRAVWRHVPGGTARSDAGVDGGASRIEWGYERRSGDSGRHKTRIPLWMPFFALLFLVLGMTFWRWRRVNAA